MIKKVAFRFLLEVNTSFKVEEVKSTDKGKKRFIKELVNAFDKDPEALSSIILRNFIDFYCGEYREELDPILKNLDDESSVILRTAKKCSPEAFRYFSHLFGDNPADITTPEDDRSQVLAREKELESEQVFDELTRKLCRFVLVNANFSEISREKRTHFIGFDKPVSKKARPDRKITIPDAAYQPTTSPGLPEAVKVVE